MTESCLFENTPLVLVVGREEQLSILSVFPFCLVRVAASPVRVVQESCVNS